MPPLVPGQKFACLTFDFDVLADWISSGQSSPATLSRGEFDLVGAERLLGLLRDHSIATTWFVPGHTADNFPAETLRIVEAGHEIGHHGYLHESPSTFDTTQAEEEALERGLRSLERITGSRPRGYRSPSWDLSDDTLRLLRSHGFYYDSSLMANDYTPYRLRIGDSIDEGGRYRRGSVSELIEMPVSWSLDDYPHFEYRRFPGFLQPGLAPTAGVLSNLVDDFRYLVERVAGPGLTVYTFHPQVIGRGHRMLMFERLLDALTDMGAIFATLSDAASELTPLWSE